MSVHLSVDGHLGCSHFLVIMSNTTLNMCVGLWMDVLSVLLGINLAAELQSW